MRPLTPDYVENGANLLLKVRKEGPRRGSMIEGMLDLVGLPLDADWAAAFVQYVGYWTHVESGGPHSTWPLPQTGSFDDMLRYAEERQVVRRTPEVGDIALVADRRTGAHRQGGIVVETRESGCLHDDKDFHEVILVEGNTDLRGAEDGGRVCRVLRRMVPDRGDCFIRWAELDPRDAHAVPWAITEKVMGRMRLGRVA